MDRRRSAQPRVGERAAAHPPGLWPGAVGVTNRAAHRRAAAPGALQDDEGPGRRHAPVRLAGPRRWVRVRAANPMPPWEAGGRETPRARPAKLKIAEKL